MAVIWIRGSGVLEYTEITRTGPLGHLTNFLSLYSMKAALGAGRILGSSPSLP